VTSTRPLSFLMPPVVLLLAVLVMIGLHVSIPVVEWAGLPVRLLGGVLVLLGLCTVLGCARLFSLAGTTVRPFQESQSLVARGPYRFSRNPIYLAMVVALVGVALLLGSISPFAAIPVFLLVIQERFIKVEEKMLEARFGEEYLRYCGRVRRWV